MISILPIELITYTVPIYEQFSGFNKNATIAGAVFKNRFELDTKYGYFTVSALEVSDVQKLTYFRGVEGAGIESVFAGVLIAFLPATFSFGYWHNEFPFM